MYELISEGLAVRFYHDGGRLLVEVTDVAAGVSWGPSPAFSLDIMSLVLQRTGEIEELKCDIEPGIGWLDVTQYIDNLFYSASVTVRFSIEGEELVARIVTERISEPQPELSLLAGVNLLPNLQYVSEDDQGYLVLPYKNGVLCYPEKHSRARDRFLIYGEQERWELLPMLPCCGAVRSTAHAALLTIVEQGDHDAECRAETDGIGGGLAGFSCRYRYTPIDPVDPQDRIVRFVPLRGNDANYAGMGRRLHQLVLAKCGRGTLEERAAQNPELAYAATAFTLKVMHAAKDVGPIDGSGRLNVYTTFADAKRQLSLIKNAGIDRLYVQLTGWNNEGHDGSWPTRFPVEPLLGGESGLKDLIAFGQSLGFQMQVHDNYIDLLKRSSDFDANLCCEDVYGEPLKRGCWAGGINFAGWPLSYPESFVSDQMELVKELGVRGVYYLDAMGMPLEISYNPIHGARRYRRACAEGINRLTTTGRETFGSCGVENGFLYCAIDADYIGSSFLDMSEPLSAEFADVPIPLWFMAVKGHAFCILNDTFRAAVDFGRQTQPTVSHRMLTMAEHGLMPRNEIAGTNCGWAYPVEPTLPAMKFEYDLIVDRLSGIGMAALVDHKILNGSPAVGNHRTKSVFSNGIEVICDYESSLLTINGEPYSLPTNLRKLPAIPKGSRAGEILAAGRPTTPESEKRAWSQSGPGL